MCAQNRAKRETTPGGVHWTLPDPIGYNLNVANQGPGLDRNLQAGLGPEHRAQGHGGAAGSRSTAAGGGDKKMRHLQTFALTVLLGLPMGVSMGGAIAAPLVAPTAGRMAAPMSGASMAVLSPTSNRLDTSRDPIGANPAGDGREGGEDIATAWVIPGDVELLPYHDTGNTCDNRNDYDEPCPDASASPDVVYSFTPSEDIVVDVDLCGSSYMTAVWVYDASETVLACDTYACWSGSFVSDLPLTGGETYYIVIDGWRNACGDYELTLRRRVHCEWDCPPGAIVEGEPPCGDGYIDLYNYGCAAYGEAYFPIVADAQGSATVCGRSCTFVRDGHLYRDQDWYEARAVGGPVTFTCRADFPLEIWLLWDVHCQIVAGEAAWGRPCETAEVSYTFSPREYLWLVVEPAIFAHVPESDYVFTVSGLLPTPVPTIRTTWGSIKARYR
jgi:hypothetical protein